MRYVAGRLGAAVAVGMLALAGCSGGGSGVSSLPVVGPASHQPGQTRTTMRGTPSTSNDCTTAPVKSIRATVSTLELAVNGTATFTVCTQYFSKYTVTNSDSSVASTTLTPSVPVDDVIYTAQVAVTALKAGTTTLTITDKKGHSATVIVTVTAPVGPLTLSCPGSVTGTTATCTYTNPNYTGPYHLRAFALPSGSCAISNFSAGETSGNFDVISSAARNCNVNLSASEGSAFASILYR